ncbi:MAG: kelch repeat-containing protein [Archangium sp.]|nr:kelch repeat-containing protein [Archangium sp.]MDP3571538.1 kelch repeat-containing protein [Archangium sp.]
MVLLAACSSELQDVTAQAQTLSRKEAALVSRLATARPWSDRAGQMLAVQLPQSAAGFARLGPASQALQLRLRDAAPSKLGLEHQDRTAVYRDVRPSTDALLISGIDWLEQLWLLRDTNAPRRLEVELAFEGEVRAGPRGALAFLDAHGDMLFSMSEPIALDAEGTRLPLEASWSSGVLTLELKGDDVHFPVLIDPLFTVGLWREVSLPGRSEHATARLGSRLVLFGGTSDGGLRDDTWEWDGTRWFRLNPFMRPTPRKGHTMTTVGNKVLLFGGEDDVNTQLNDLWEWDGNTWTKRVTTNYPPTRQQHGAAALGSSLLIFGGLRTQSGTNAPLGDTWLWNGQTWTEVQGPAPSARLGAALAALGNRIILSGGVGLNFNDDLWEWTGTTWNPLTSAGPRPSARSGAAMVNIGGKLLLYGGTTIAGLSMETWEFDGVRWTLVGTVAPSINPSLTFFQNQPLLIGGWARVGGTPMSSVYRWSGTAWTALTGNGPFPRDVLAAERGTDVLVVSTGETWLWNGDEWRQLMVTSPPRRSFGAMATVGTKTILFGGILNGQPQADTWEWDGISWTLKSPATSPSPRLGHSMARRGANLVLFGGQTANGDSAETWEWDGTTWIDRTSAGPSARAFAAMATRGNNVTLFGGGPSFGAWADTWEWDGTSWSPGQPATSPLARSGHAMASYNGSVLLFGGGTSSNPSLGTWLWDGSNWARFSAPEPRDRTGHAMAGTGSKVVLFGGAFMPETWEFLAASGLGAICTSDDECLSRACIDGVCCETTCGGGLPDCEACSIAKGSSSDGVCSALAAGRVCRPSTNFCDVSEVCTGTSRSCPPDLHRPALTPCRAASCQNDVATVASKCSAMGTCPLETQSCGAGTCNGAICDGCAADTECANSQWCRGGVCALRLVLGSVCSVDRQCQSGVCADAVCCSSPCRGQCEACGPGGQCLPVVGAPIGGRPTCVTNSATCAGSCDGTNGSSCTYPLVGTCRPEQCVGSQYTAPGTCDGAGGCAAGTSSSCSPGKCTSSNACTLECARDSDCSAGATCVGQRCTVRGLCTDARQCSSGFCVDGICCDRACEGTCEACDVAGQAGTCVPVTGAPHGRRTDCTGSGICKGTCNGINRERCSHPTSVCGPPLCVDAKVVNSRCDGRGACVAQEPISCDPFVCGGGQCPVRCTGDETCAADTTCDAGVCMARPAGGCGCSSVELAPLLALVALTLRRRSRATLSASALLPQTGRRGR